MSRAPQRIQRKRTKGWKMPPNTVCVTRPGKFGNPFIVGVDGTAEECKQLYALLAAGYLCISKSAEHIARQKRAMLAIKQAKTELAGKDVACFCRLAKPCHADVLLEIANAEVIHE